MSKPKIILIAGPTASGKSALALALAEKLGGEVINADSMQVYRDLRIITARPTPDEERRVPHRLYGHVDAAENYSTGRWCADAARGARRGKGRRKGRDRHRRHRRSISARLTRGLAAVPPIPAEIRKAVRARLASEGAPALHAELAARDPATCRATERERPRPGHARARSGAGDRPFAARLAR